jgi:hypothetical protein
VHASGNGAVVPGWNQRQFTHATVRTWYVKHDSCIYMHILTGYLWIHTNTCIYWPYLWIHTNTCIYWPFFFGTLTWAYRFFLVHWLGRIVCIYCRFGPSSVRSLGLVAFFLSNIRIMPTTIQLPGSERTSSWIQPKDTVTTNVSGCIASYSYIYLHDTSRYMQIHSYTYASYLDIFGVTV